MFDGSQAFTVFAPTNAAFAKLPKATLDAVLSDRALLTKVLTYHVVSGSVPAAKLLRAKKVQTVQGQNVNITVRNNQLFINDSRVISTDIETKSGTIQVIDSVLIPR